MAGLGFGIGMVDSSMMPQLGYLVDIRHGSVYGGVYAIGDIAFCMGFAVGPALSGSLVQATSFKAMMVGIGLISFCYGPLLVLLKDPPPRSEQEKQETTVSYIRVIWFFSNEEDSSFYFKIKFFDFTNFEEEEIFGFGFQIFLIVK